MKRLFNNSLLFLPLKADGQKEAREAAAASGREAQLVLPSTAALQSSTDQRTRLARQRPLEANSVRGWQDPSAAAPCNPLQNWKLTNKNPAIDKNMEEVKPSHGLRGRKTSCKLSYKNNRRPTAETQ